MNSFADSATIENMKMNNEIVMERNVMAGKASVMDSTEYAGRVRYLMVNRTVQSGIYLSEDRRYDLLFPYLDRITWLLNRRPDIHSIFLIGGGACAFARTVIHKYPQCTIDVAENDPEMIRIGEEYFDLKLTEKEAGDRMHIFIEDGMKALTQSKKKYDLIINDAFFSAKSIARSADDTAKIREHLADSGIYVVNVTGAPAGIHSFKVHRYEKMLKKQFSYVQMVIAEEDRDRKEKQNILAYASDLDQSAAVNE